jgi:hypothetical protein
MLNARGLGRALWDWSRWTPLTDKGTEGSAWALSYENGKVGALVSNWTEVFTLMARGRAMSILSPYS